MFPIIHLLTWPWLMFPNIGAQPTQAATIPKYEVSPPLLIPQIGAYHGAYLDFGVDEDRVTFEAIEDFTTLVGKSPAIIAFGNNWGMGQFPTDQATIVHNFGAVPLILWYGREISNEIPTTKFTLTSIIAGRWDDYLDSWGRAAKAINGNILVSWGLEMNGSWYPWSGVFNGAARIIPHSDKPNYLGPDTYRRAYRHIIKRVRAAGATNISWVFHVNNKGFPDQPWNAMAQYYPGPEYIDWIGMSAYGKLTPKGGLASVDKALLQPYAELAAIDVSKPIIIAEWSIGEFPKVVDKGAWINEAMTHMQRLPRLKAAIYWHERWQNSDLSYSNLRVNSSLTSLTIYRNHINQPFWLDQPLISHGNSNNVANLVINHNSMEGGDPTVTLSR